MSDNPFLEPDDSDRTIIRPVPGGSARRPATPPLAQPMPASRAPSPFDAVPPPSAPASPSYAPDARGSDIPGRFAIGSTPLLAAAAPLLQLLARLRNTANPPDTGDLRERTVRQIREFETTSRDTGVPMEQLRPAHYALCASLDDVVLNTPWGSSGGWDQRSLVSTFHKEVRSGERFFDLLKQMKDNPGTFMPVLELMYLCLSLGFIGQYRVSPRGPAEIDRIREDLYAIITRQRAAPNPELAPHWQGVSSPYRPSRARLPLWVAGAGALAAVAALFTWSTTGLNAASDDLFARMLAAPPATMPQITRAALVQPPAPSPEPPPPGALDRLRAFLAPEIAQGLVSVVGTQAVPIVRISNRGMFPSGSATAQASFKPLLERIGAALKDEPGTVKVVGYTDNQAIHTVAFPSNFALSTGRAEAAKTLIAATVGDASRISAEGRADAEPIASNATPEGREKNRRIEVVLHRQET